MKTFSRIAAQGEITLIRIGDVKPGAKLPAGCTPLQPEDGVVIVGHSETGHHHVLAADGVTAGVLDRAPEGMRILHIILQSANELTHLRGHDTHETIRVEPGEYRAISGREYDPYQQLARRQAD
ncbi:hypothetical protein GCM10008171_32500 [Methylopila jiangsuensis]|uniref:Uncharacterized protein n=1 Tax=Methylopila jiangsuensis TaxID=586230 RepID=A0A9W6N588_9HYPH|nr:hypothetical protein [Methylopila jiangsuensis]MDR6284614.1 hypothetical protein [Methylopila jiangsuensis]GLK77996.1 hypothetical protein GCM10008171_32500 [Methylopila jiangsuensis]